MIDELDLGGAAANRIAFSNTTIASLEVQGSRFKDVDLRGASFDRVSGPESLGGAIVDSGQLALLAPLLAESMGLRVVD